jgi:glutathione synthase/RimK-type ligase-like ATP-grasp enzyme
MENQEGWSIDAELAFPPLQAMGWTIDALPWRTENVDWDSFDAVYVGTPWDYPEDPGRFMQVLETIDRSNAVLINDMELLSWSMPKTYLIELEQKGVAIVPSIWAEQYEHGMLDDAFDRFAGEKIIIKPVISTNASDTYLIARREATGLEPKLCENFANRPCLIQPFMENIQSEGEYSLFYFNREFSHAIRKTPKPGDFRVQEEHGATLVALDPEPSLRAAGDRVLRLVDPIPVYARVDFVRDRKDRFLLMELELVEPSMYLRMDDAAPERFARAFDEYFTKVSGD